MIFVAAHESSSSFFRPIHEKGVGESSIDVPSPTTPLSPSMSNVTGRGGTRLAYQRNTRDYVDNNANSINNAVYNEPTREDSLINLIDKLQENGSKGEGVSEPVQKPANLVLDTSEDAKKVSEVSPSDLKTPQIMGEKLPNGDIKMVNFTPFFF